MVNIMSKWSGYCCCVSKAPILMFVDYIKDGPRPMQDAEQKARLETGTLRRNRLS